MQQPRELQNTEPISPVSYLGRLAGSEVIKERVRFRNLVARRLGSGVSVKERERYRI